MIVPRSWVFPYAQRSCCVKYAARFGGARPSAYTASRKIPRKPRRWKEKAVAMSSAMHVSSIPPIAARWLTRKMQFEPVSMAVRLT